MPPLVGGIRNDAAIARIEWPATTPRKLQENWLPSELIIQFVDLYTALRSATLMTYTTNSLSSIVYRIL